MLSVVEVIGSQGSFLRLPLDEETGGISIEDIEGLGPVKATLVSSSFANLDGAQFHNSRREPRNIKIRFGLSPDYANQDTQDLRNRLYEFFMPKTEVKLRFISHTGFAVDISGVVEDFPTALFSQEPTVEIVLICFDPSFRSVQEFVFEAGTTSGTDEVVLNYTGTVETGILFAILPNRSISDFTIHHRPPDGTLRTLSFSAPLVLNDRVEINTNPGSKRVTLKRSNVESSLLYAQSPQSDWITLQPGSNRLRVAVSGAAIPYSIRYMAKYGGL